MKIRQGYHCDRKIKASEIKIGFYFSTSFFQFIFKLEFNHQIFLNHLGAWRGGLSDGARILAEVILPSSILEEFISPTAVPLSSTPKVQPRQSIAPSHLNLVQYFNVLPEPSEYPHLLSHEEKNHFYQSSPKCNHLQ